MNAQVSEAVTADLAFREKRRKYLGGSDISAMLGIAPPGWKRNTPLALYLDKTEPPKEDTHGKLFKRRGKRWESVVAEMLQEKLEEQGHTVQFIRANERYVDPDFDYFACEIDWEVYLDGEPDITNIELKTVHPYKVSEWGEEGTDESPVWYTAQAQWGLGITRRKRCIIAPLFGADEVRVYLVDAAPDVIADIRKVGATFWNDHVLARVPPPPGGLIDLSRLFPTDAGRTIDALSDQTIIDAIAALRAAGEDEDRAKARWNAAEFTVKNYMGDAAILTIGGYKACSWKTSPSNRVDTTRLKEERPEVYREFFKEGTTRKFLLTKEKT